MPAPAPASLATRPGRTRVTQAADPGSGNQRGDVDG
jgi:hypothetical protein